MELRTGVDLVEVWRIRSAIDRFGARFLERVFTPQELKEAGNRGASLAARFAAKEATSKALGTGIGAVAWQDIEILYGPDHQPIIQLHEEAARCAEELHIVSWSLSLSHTSEYAVAFVAAMVERGTA